MDGFVKDIMEAIKVWLEKNFVFINEFKIRKIFVIMSVENSLQYYCYLGKGNLP